MKKITFTLSTELFEQVEHLTKLNGCSVAQMVAELVELGYLEKRLYPIGTRVGVENNVYTPPRQFCLV